ncbi:C-type lectin domain family 4 member C-like isoform X1 [Haliotis asinina]|uniref:C-type lectin domain family 4 member C-like isoform X1 n=1 Tax=Haliotis asinina TaxID=109174 RepID=UPI00353234C8
MNGRVLTLTLIILVIHVQHFDLKKHRHNDRVRHCGRQCQHSIVKRVEHRMEKTVNRTIRKIRKEYEAYQKKYESLLHAMRKELECLSHLCPTGFIRYKKFCFRFVMHSKKTWRDAQKYCQDAGANLIFLNSTKKQEFVAKHLKDNFASHVQTVFTSGIHCDASYIPYSWEPGKKKPTYDNLHWRWEGKRSMVGTDPTDLQWCNGEIPTNLKFTDLNTCLILSKTCAWKWSAGKCQVERPFICEMKLDPGKRTCMNC